MNGGYKEKFEESIKRYRAAQKLVAVYAPEDVMKGISEFLTPQKVAELEKTADGRTVLSAWRQLVLAVEGRGGDRTNNLRKTRYSSPMLVSVEAPFDPNIAAEARTELSKNKSYRDQDSVSLIHVFEQLWRGECKRDRLYLVFHLDIYYDWATAVNRISGIQQAASPAQSGGGQ